MEETKKSDSRNIIAIILIVLLVGVGGIFIFRKFSKNSSSNTASSSVASASITGNLDINGVVPAGANLVLSSQESGSGAAPTDFSTINNPTDQASWTFSSATSGKTYVILGTLKASDGSVLTKSAPITVTAPGSNQIITLNLSGKSPTGTAEISGTIKVNGYFPSGSTISLLTKTPNTQFQVARQNIPAQASTPISTDKAVAGQEYQVVGYLYDSAGNKIGDSDVLTIDAPARNEVLNINSNASAPAPTGVTPAKSKISGTVQLNGVAPSNSRIVILQAPKNSSDFTVAVDNVPATSGQAWVWTGAQAGTWYNLQAVLKQRQSNGTDMDIAVSDQMTVAAPAINVMFTLNTGIAPSITPSPTPSQ